MDGWLDTVLDDVRSGEARLATASVDGVVRALGRWQRQSAAVFRPHAEIRQLMVHPAARGLGLGRLVGQALVDDARARRFESLTLEVRGNNHGAMRLYEGLGFREVGSYPDQVALGDERWDRVLFYLGLDVGPAVVRHGRRREGPAARELMLRCGHHAVLRPSRPMHLARSA